ncbi:MAG: hypothetical protein WBE76_00630 [Terracidiphilus sp.]
MSGERWGAFSVIDHIDAAALAADVLLYDKLVLPVPPNESEAERWELENWQPGLQQKRLEVLGELAEPVEWDDDRQRMYDREMEELRKQGATVNGFQLTGIVLAQQPRNVDVVAAYHSTGAFHSDYPAASRVDKKALVAHLLGQRFAVPKGDPETALKKAIEVAKLPEFKEHRLALYDWQQVIVEKQTPPIEAVKKMEQLLNSYNDCVERAVKSVYYKLGFTVAGIALTLAGAPANPLVAGGALLTMAQFAAM